MAEFFLYTTNTGYTGTLLNRSDTSFVPLPPDTGEILSTVLVPTNQPLYLWRESGGTIIPNTQQNVDAYLEDTQPISPDDPVDTGTFTGYTATTDVKLWNIFQPLDGTTPDDQRFEEYSTQQLANGQPIFLHDPTDLGFVFTGLTTGKAYNNLPWIGINGGGSAPRLKLDGGSVFTSVGVRGVEFFIETDANVEVLGLSEHASVDLTEIRFDVGGTGNSLTVRAVNLTVGRIEGQTGTSNFIIKDRSNVQAQNLNEIENVYVEGGSILTVNWVRINTLIELGFNGTSVDNDGAIVTLAKPQNLTTGEIVIFGQNNILTASNFPITIDSGATNNVILGMNNTITDNGSGNIILQDLTGNTGGADGVVSGATLNSSAQLILSRTENLPDVIADLSALSGGTTAEVPLYAFSKTQAGGTQDESFNLTINKPSTGTYDYTFDNAASNANYGVFAQPYSTVTDTNAFVSNVTSNGFTITIGEGDNGGSPDTPIDTEHAVMIYGVPISGQTGIPVVSFSTFTGYTATTENKIDYISGVTDNKYDVSGGTITGSVNANGNVSAGGNVTAAANGVFAGSVLEGGTSLINKYLQISNFNTYSGNTQTEINNKVSKGGDSDGSTLEIGTIDTQELVLKTDDTPRITIQSDGDIGFGTSSPLARFHAQGSDANQEVFIVRGVAGQVDSYFEVRDDTNLDLIKVEGDGTLSTDQSNYENKITSDGDFTTKKYIDDRLADASIQLIDSAGGQSLNDVTPNPIEWNTQDIINTSLFTHSGLLNPTEITVLNTGRYSISYNVNGDSGGNRVVVGVAFRLNGSGFINATLSTSYMRNSSNDDTQNTIAPFLIDLTANDTLEVVAFRLGDNTTTTTKANESFVRIDYLG
jgi:hypothetical protein